MTTSGGAEDRTTKNRTASTRAAAAGRARIAHDVVALTDKAACIAIDLDSAGVVVMVFEAAAIVTVDTDAATIIGTVVKAAGVDARRDTLAATKRWRPSCRRGTWLQA